nr:uncharacterized protein LOC117222165 isoform X2 [Megalopta genalis]
MEYTQKHKILLQTFVHEGVLDENNAKELVIKLFDVDNVPLIINQINEQLQPLDMLIKRCECEITGELFWIFANTELDEVTRYQDEFSEMQLALLRNVFSEIITSNDGSVKSMFCLNLCSLEDVKMSKAEAEEFLNDMVDRKWLAYKGERCNNCQAMLHLHCLKRYATVHNPVTCPTCKSAFPNTTLI